VHDAGTNAYRSAVPHKRARNGDWPQFPAFSPVCGFNSCAARKGIPVRKQAANPSNMWLIVASISAAISVPTLFFLFLQLPFSPSKLMEGPYVSNAESTREFSSPLPAQHALEPANGLINEAYERSEGLGLESQLQGDSDKGNHKDYVEIAEACLRGKEPVERLLQLLTHPEHDVRVATVYAICRAQGVLGPDGHFALLRLWQEMGDQTESMVDALLETLEVETLNGNESNVPYLLMTMDKPGSDAIRSLIWASDNHKSPRMRVWTMNATWMLEPEAETSKKLIRRRLQDPSAHVRRQALQAWIFRPLQSAFGSK